MIKKIALVFSMFIFVFLLTSCGDREVEVQWIDISCPNDIEITHVVDIWVNIIPNDANNQGYNLSVDFPNIANLINESQLEGFQEGTVTITVQSHDGNYYDSCIVNVHPQSP